MTPKLTATRRGEGSWVPCAGYHQAEILLLVNYFPKYTLCVTAGGARDTNSVLPVHVLTLPLRPDCFRCPYMVVFNY